MEIDFILSTMSVNFLCREIHFEATDNAVVIVAGLVSIWVLLRFLADLAFINWFLLY